MAQRRSHSGSQRRPLAGARAPTPLLLALLVALPAAARAEQPRELLRRGVEALNAGALEQAAELLAQADQAAADGRLRAEIRLQRGLADAMLGRFDAAQQLFAAALALEPTLTLDAARFGPKIDALYVAARDGLRGEVEIASDPPGAAVSVDGRRVGRTPLVLSLRIGERVLRIERRGRDVQRTVRVAAGRRETLRIRLRAPREAGRPLRTWTWITGGTALAAGGVGLGLYLAAGGQVEEHDREMDPVRREQLASSIRSKDLGALICGGVAVGLGATAVVLLILDRKAAASRRAWLAPMLGTATGLSAGAAF